jgi:thioester reductase-like protein
LPTLSIKNFYEGKNVLLTGCTGFLGKVILEKLMRTCPGINKFYIMVRPKRNKEPFERIKNEILNSYVFSVVKKQHEDFYAWAESKMVPIVGDLVVDNLGLSDAHREMVVNDCNIIINSAASVNFDDPLQEAL